LEYRFLSGAAVTQRWWLAAFPALWLACTGGCAQPTASAGASGSAGSSGSAGERAGGSGGTSGSSGGAVAEAGVTARGGAVATGGTKSAAGGASTGGSPAKAGNGGAGAGAGAKSGAGGVNAGEDALGAYPFTPSPVTRGGTMTFTNVGAAGWWPRRIDRPAGDAACNYKDGSDTWGAHCCMKEEQTTSTTLAPFDEEMVLILKAIDIKQLAVYQPSETAGAYARVTAWDRRAPAKAKNLWFTQKGDGSAMFSGDLTHDDCVGYLSQAPLFACGDGRDYFCPDDDGVLHQGFSGSKLVVFLGSMNFADSGVAKCDGGGGGQAAPWVAFVASELVRDGGRKWNGACNCYSKTGTVGDGCGEINVFEVVMDNNDFSNREFASTGVRSFQAGHVGGAVCKANCDRSAFPADVEVIDACAQKAYERGPELVMGGATAGCPVWRRPDGDRYFFILLDEQERAIQVGIVHPANIPPALAAVLPALPNTVSRADIDALVRLRLPE
jgi:hypothetical protein